jgi:hypothetical protein
VSCVNGARRISGLAWAANWKAKQAALLPSSRLSELRSPPVRLLTSTPEKEFVVPVLLH